MKWKLFELVGDKVSNEPFSYMSNTENNFVLNSQWCDSPDFPKEFDSPEDAGFAFKELCVNTFGKKYIRCYTNLDMVCLPFMSVSYFDVKEAKEAKGE